MIARSPLPLTVVSVRRQLAQQSLSGRFVMLSVSRRTLHAIGQGG